MNSLLQKNTFSRKKIDFWSALPWVWLVCAYCFTMGFLALHGRAYIDSDMAGEMVLADLLNKEGGIFSSNWGYSTEIRVFYLQIFYRIALLIFPHNWYAAHMLGQAAWMLLLAGCYLYAARGVGLKSSGAWGAAALMCPFGIWYLWYGPFGGFYIPHMVLLLLSFGFAVRIVYSSQKIKIFLYLLLLALVSFINGLGSIKGILALYLPMCVAAVFLILFALQQHPDIVPKTELRYLAVSIYTLVFAGIGYLINSKILAAHYSFSTHNDRIWGSLDLSLLLKTWCEFLSLLGFPSTELSFVPVKVELFSLYGILGALSLVLILLAVLSLIALIRHSASLPKEGLIAFYTFLAICLVQGAVFAFTTGSDSPNPSYWLTPIPFIFIILQLAWQIVPFRFSFSRKSLAVIFMVCVTGVSISTVHTFFSDPLRAVPELEPVAAWLSQNGYTNGYASLWNCNIMTEWSNGQLDMRAVNEYTLDVTQTNTWLERLDHVTPPEGKVFLALSAQELWGAHKESIRNDYNVYWDENDYLVMAFDSYDEMVTALQNAHEG